MCLARKRQWVGIWYLVSGIWYLVSGIWYLVRTIGLERAKVKIGLINFVYNMKRLVQLHSARHERG